MSGRAGIGPPWRFSVSPPSMETASTRIMMPPGCSCGSGASSYLKTDGAPFRNRQRLSWTFSRFFVGPKLPRTANLAPENKEERHGGLHLRRRAHAHRALCRRLAYVRTDDLAALADQGADGAQRAGRLGAGGRGVPRLRQPGGRGQPQCRAHGGASVGIAGGGCRGTTINRLCASGLDAVGQRRAGGEGRRSEFRHRGRRGEHDARALRDGQGGKARSRAPPRTTTPPSAGASSIRR